MIRTTPRQIPDVIDVEDRLALAVGLTRHARASRALALPARTDQHGPPGCRTTRIVDARSPRTASSLPASLHPREQLGVGGLSRRLRSRWVVFGRRIRFVDDVDDRRGPLLGRGSRYCLEHPFQLDSGATFRISAVDPCPPQDHAPRQEGESATNRSIPEANRLSSGPRALQVRVTPLSELLRPGQPLPSVAKRSHKRRRIIVVRAVGIRKNVHSRVTGKGHDAGDLIAAVLLVERRATRVRVPQNRRARLCSGHHFEPEASQNLGCSIHAAREVRGEKVPVIWELAAVRSGNQGLRVDEGTIDTQEVLTTRCKSVALEETLPPELGKLFNGSDDRPDVVEERQPGHARAPGIRFRCGPLKHRTLTKSASDGSAMSPPAAHF